MGSVDVSFVCGLCGRWRPYDGHPLYDACVWVPFGCCACHDRFYASSEPWQTVFLYNPLKLVFCNRLPMNADVCIWSFITEFLSVDRPDRPHGIPLFLMYDDMVSHWIGPARLFMMYTPPQPDAVAPVAHLPDHFSPLPTTPCTMPLKRCLSAPVLCASVSPQQECPALITMQSALKCAVGQQCNSNDIWLLRRHHKKERYRDLFMPWRFRLWKHLASLLNAPALHLYSDGPVPNATDLMS